MSKDKKIIDECMKAMPSETKVNVPLVKLTKNQIEKLDKIAASGKEPLTRIKCNIHKGEGICDCCDTKNHEFLYSGFKSAAFYSFGICPLCLYNLINSK